MKLASSRVHTQASAPDLGAYVGDPSHEVSVSSDLIPRIGQVGGASVTLPNGLNVSALPKTPAGHVERSGDLKAAFLTGQHVTKLTSLLLDRINSELPALHVRSHETVQALEIVVVGFQAAKTLTGTEVEKEGGKLKAGLALTELGLEILKMAGPMIPHYEKIAPAVSHVSFYLKMGDEIIETTVSAREYTGHSEL